MNLGSNGIDPPIIAWITDEEVFVASLDLAAERLIGPMVVSSGVVPFAHHLERPAVSVRANGAIDVAFTALSDSGGSVYWTHLVNDGRAEPQRISGEPMPETNLVHSTVDPAGGIALAWLEDSTLSVATMEGDQLEEIENVDDLTCDCCNPVPWFFGDRLLIAYRDLDRTGEGTVRNVSAIASDDRGATFGPVIGIADGDWFIEGCPFTGPSIVEVSDRIVVAWMDARQVDHPDQHSSSIWVDVSHDGGASFGPDVQVTGEGLNRWPVMAVDGDGLIHLVWERRGSDAGLYHVTSSDDGSSFSPAQLLVDAAAGQPRSPSVIVHGNVLIVSWTVPDGGRVAAWNIGG